MELARRMKEIFDRRGGGGNGIGQTYFSSQENKKGNNGLRRRRCSSKTPRMSRSIWSLLSDDQRDEIRCEEEEGRKGRKRLGERSRFGGFLGLKSTAQTRFDPLAQIHLIEL